MPLQSFHPLIREWFERRFGAPTKPQELGWPRIAARQHTLIAAPTGSGKTLAAFLVCLDRLWRDWLAGELSDGVRVVYVSPLKALSNDIERNLQGPLAEIRELAEQRGYPVAPLRAAVRTGDTPQAARQRMLREPPHILVTTPESLYLLITSGKSRELLTSVDTVIVDEIHALARDKRGSHLALTLERLAALGHQPPVRIGLSATQRPIDEIARFLVGSQVEEVVIEKSQRPDNSEAPNSPGTNSVFVVDAGHARDVDLAVEVPPTELSAVCSHEQWGEVYARMVELIQSHRSTLVFVNTRRLAERVSHHLRELLGEEAVAGHHGSMSRETRHDVEQKLKNGQLKAIVATASLEMGIDIGYIDLVCQVGSCRSIATFLQRVGRSGHSLGLTPKGRLFPLTRDELLESLALVRAVRCGILDRIEIPVAPLDILAQQIVAATACEEWDEDGLLRLCRRAWPYRDLTQETFEEVLELLAHGIGKATKRGTYLHRDRINRRLKARRGARIAALTSGGAIPDTAQYRVIVEPEGTFVGTLDEDFAIESMAGDIFLLGNTSWRVQHVRAGEVVVRDAEGAPPSIPFWFGEGPGRTIELSAEISRLRADIAEGIAHADGFGVKQDNGNEVAWLQAECGATQWAAEQTVNYIASQWAALGVVPTKDEIVFERFFDESGGMQLVIHAPLGSRINRAWGLALRKRFCRSFDFELQAAATDNGVLLSLSPQHSFPIDALFKMLGTHNGRQLLEQAVLAAPMFQVRWRWNITRSLAVLRSHGGKRVPPHMLRFRSDDLLAAAFPETVGCLEYHHGDVEIPDHPLVRQTMHDCLTEAMDVERWLGVLADIQAARIRLLPFDTREPSPFCHELLNANPYAFLDGAALEERRTRAVATRRGFTPEDVRDLARLDPEAIAQVREEAWPLVRDADELHDTLQGLVALPAEEAAAWREWFDELITSRRASVVETRAHGVGVKQESQKFWIAAERWPTIQAIFPQAIADPPIALPEQLNQPVERTAAVVDLVRGRMSVRGPARPSQLAAELGLETSHVSAALEALEATGTVLRGKFTDSSADEIEWCDRRLLARIHRLTLDGLRQRIKPVAPEDFMRFLVRRQRLAGDAKWTGAVGVREALGQLQGFEMPAGAWESRILAARCADYDPQWLDHLFLVGEVAWGRLRTPRRDEANPSAVAAMTRAMPISLLLREDLPWLVNPDREPAEILTSGYAQQVLESLTSRGALFFPELKTATGLLPSHLEEALRELAALGLITSDAFGAVRSIASEKSKHQRGRRKAAPAGLGVPVGRWSRFPGLLPEVSPAERLERWCRLLLRRYGVLFRDLLVRESCSPPWHELAPVLRRLELRGELRGGRFISGVAGEQFAEEPVVGELRTVRETGPDHTWLLVSAVDPLNLAGIVIAGRRIAANQQNMLILQDGRCIAAKEAGHIEFLADVAVEVQAEMRRALQTGRPAPRSHLRAAWLDRQHPLPDRPQLSSRVPSRSLRKP